MVVNGPFNPLYIMFDRFNLNFQTLATFLYEWSLVSPLFNDYYYLLFWLLLAFKGGLLLISLNALGFRGNFS